MPYTQTCSHALLARRALSAPLCTRSSFASHPRFTPIPPHCCLHRCSRARSLPPAVLLLFALRRRPPALALSVVFCVNSIVEQLERVEDEAELSFFEAEKTSIHAEFAMRVEELRIAIMKADLESMERRERELREEHLQQQQQQHQRSNSKHAVLLPSALAPSSLPPSKPLPVPAASSSTASLPSSSAPHPSSAAATNGVAHKQSTQPLQPQQPIKPPQAAASSSAHSTAASSSELLVTIIAGKHEYRVPASDLRECAAYDGNASSLSLPPVEPAAFNALLAFIRRSNPTASSASPNLLISDLVPPSLLSAAIDLSNLLAHPLSFLLLSALLFERNGGGRAGADLGFLHKLLSESFFSKLPVASVVKLQDRVLSPLASAASASSSSSPSSSLPQLECIESIKAVLNMYFYQQTAAHFPSFKQYLKRRNALLLDGGSADPQQMREAQRAASWLEAQEDTAAAAAALASSTSDKKKGKKGGGTGGAVAAAPVLWVRVYVELYLAMQAPHLHAYEEEIAAAAAAAAAASSISSSSAASISSSSFSSTPPSTAHTTAVLLTSLGFLVHFVAFDGSSDAASGSPSLFFSNLHVLIRHTPHLRALAFTSFPASSGLDVAALERIIALCPSHLARIHLQAVPTVTPASIARMDLRRYPKLRITME